ncbi:MAG: PQQ-binding-like beta-propeller repeat protein [Gammaproteobacteria bacterium]|nr:PQQ-binding-like beta-propeller repeat protein [Gammaproteobacteria bacterium]
MKIHYLMFFSMLLLLASCADNSSDSAQAGASESVTKVEIPHSTKEIDAGEGEVYANMRGTSGGGKEHPGSILYQAHCASCHSQAVPRAPHLSFLQMLPGDMILHTLNEGAMQAMATKLDGEQKQQIAEFIAGNTSAEKKFPLLMCENSQKSFDYSSHPFADGWGMDYQNTRFIPAEIAQLEKSDLSGLKLKWAFAYPGMIRARSHPTLVGGGIIVGSQDGSVYFLDEESGCVRWVYRSSAEIRSGISVSDWQGDEKIAEPPIAYFADLIARVHAINLETGELLWMTKVDAHPNATTTAQPLLYEGVIYQTVSSLEEAAAVDPSYTCCSFRGSVVALDAMSGKEIWKSYTIKEEPKQVGVSSAGLPIFAPSGAPVWNTPALDEKRGLLYFGTGGNYSSPSQDTSDALLAMDIKSGEIKWARQTTKGDAWNVACFPFVPSHANCPEEDGPDVDFAAAMVHVIDGEREILVGAQKSGDVFGIDPVNTEIVWHQKPGRGGNQGGINFGLAAEGSTVFVPVADYDDGLLPIEDARPGLYAFDAFSGEALWSSPTENVCADREHCDPGISAPVTAVPNIVFAGHLDSRLRAYDSKTGEVLWEHDTFQNVTTVSGEVAHGGSISGGTGPIVANGRVYANSGYGIYFHTPGNVLMVFEKEK